ncbi:MAG: hypothetical protein CM1200mP9_08450 [Gammaproteobacteria bacterium]|nr:MAG: hypothetical protein CM1200mP9_08450 [Gammaproteobacteria bacterium]
MVPPSFKPQRTRTSSLEPICLEHGENGCDATPCRVVHSILITGPTPVQTIRQHHPQCNCVDDITLRDRIDDVLVVCIHDFTKDRVIVVKMGGRHMRDKELRTVGTRSQILPWTSGRVGRVSGSRRIRPQTDSRGLRFLPRVGNLPGS